MAFQYIRNLYGGAPIAPPGDNYPFTEGDNDEVTAGKVYKYDGSGEMEEVSDTDDNSTVIALEDADQADTFRGMYILPGMVFRADIEGTGEPSNFEEGDVGVQINNAEEVKDDATHDAGPLTVLRVYESDHDEDVWYADVVFCKSAFHHTTSA